MSEQLSDEFDCAHTDVVVGVEQAGHRQKLEDLFEVELVLAEINLLKHADEYFDTGINDACRMLIGADCLAQLVLSEEAEQLFGQDLNVSGRVVEYAD